MGGPKKKKKKFLDKIQKDIVDRIWISHLNRRRTLIFSKNF